MKVTEEDGLVIVTLHWHGPDRPDGEPYMDLCDCRNAEPLALGSRVWQPGELVVFGVVVDLQRDWVQPGTVTVTLAPAADTGCPDRIPLAPMAHLFAPSTP